MKIGVIGDKTSIQGFAALNIDTYPAASDKQIRKTILDMAGAGYTIIFITEQAASVALETIERFKTQPFPAIIPIPNNRGSLGMGMETIRQNVEKAVGMDIFAD